MNQEKPEASTKDRILDAAEHLFAEHGFDGVSLRSIIAEAGVNLAAVHYHFHSKEALMEAVFVRRMAPLNQERLEALAKCEREAGGQPVPVDKVVAALLMPTLRLVRDPARNGPTFCRLMGRLHAEGVARLEGMLKRQMGDVTQRYAQALRRALPELAPNELFWRLHFSMGAMAQLLRGARILAVMSGDIFDPADLEAGMPRLITFLAAGLSAPSGVPKTQELENVHS